MLTLMFLIKFTRYFNCFFVILNRNIFLFYIFLWPLRMWSSLCLHSVLFPWFSMQRLTIYHPLFAVALPSFHTKLLGRLIAVSFCFSWFLYAPWTLTSPMYFIRFPRYSNWLFLILNRNVLQFHILYVVSKIFCP